MVIKIDVIEKNYINEVVDVHMHSFPGFFLTFLGPKFLKEFYKSFIVDDTGIGFIALEDGKVLGAIVGPLVPDGYFKRLLKRQWWAFCYASIGAVLRCPSVIKRLLRALFYRGEAPPGPTRALLSSIAVLPSSQRLGIGKALVERWVQEVRQKGGKGCYLTTDAKDNDKVNGFYQRLNWKIESTYTTPEGRVMNRYVFDFDDEDKK